MSSDLGRFFTADCGGCAGPRTLETFPGAWNASTTTKSAMSPVATNVRGEICLRADSKFLFIRLKILQVYHTDGFFTFLGRSIWYPESMDVISHALWTNLVFRAAKVPPNTSWLAALFGVMPDLVSFGPDIVVRLLRLNKFVPIPVSSGNWRRGDI